MAKNARRVLGEIPMLEEISPLSSLGPLSASSGEANKKNPELVGLRKLGIAT